MQINEVILASTLHEPENRLSELIVRHNKFLEEAFQYSIVVVSPKTHQRVVKLLGELDFKVFEGSVKVSETYKAALRRALEEEPSRLLYCDFDRMLHWVNAYPDELTKVNKLLSDHDLLILGRTDRAFRTHPKTQTETESIANQIASKILGFEQIRDVISACWGLSTSLANSLLHIPSENKYGFYCEWPIVAWRLAKNPGYIEVDGLEWETPDRYKEEIKAKGYEKWLHEFQTPQEWEKRIEILGDVTTSMLKYI